MKAMILAAGLGTRLKPLTATLPKALVELSGRTLLEITLTRLRTFGINEVIINVHHFADMVIAYLKSHDNFGMRIEISREELLLDTGGGLKKAAWFFQEDPNRPHSKQMDEPFLLHNVDVISNIDFARMLQFHKENQALATLAVQSRQSSRLLLFNDKNRLVGRAATDATTSKENVIPSEARNRGKVPARLKSDQTGPAAPMDCHPERSEESASSSNSPLATRHSPLPLAFSGIHIISPRLLPQLTEEGIFSIVPSYLRLAAQGQKILAFRADQYYWRDLGRPSDLSLAALDIERGLYAEV